MSFEIQRNVCGPIGYLQVRGDGDEGARGRCCAGVGRPEGMGVSVAAGAWGWR
jgi:hypothetical protein